MRVKLFFVFISVFTQLLFCQTTKELDSLFTHYKILNEAEKKLPEFKDNNATLKLKIAQLKIINASRKKHKAQAVALDILACRVANKMCVEATENNYLSHFNLAGEKPYHRHAFAGGVHHVTENAAATWTSGDFSETDDFKAEQMEFLHKQFMAERAPKDGHKQNCIGKFHNYVGLGLFMNSKRLSYYEEFIDRYLVFEDLPFVGSDSVLQVEANKNFNFKVTVPTNSYLMYACAYYEKLLKPMKAKKINKIDHYEDYGSTATNVIQPWDLVKQKTENTYTLSFLFKKPGLYYVQLYIDKKEISKQSSYTTKNWNQASGIVIRVE